MGWQEKLKELTAKLSEESVAEAMTAPFFMAKIRIWPWTVGTEDDARLDVLVEMLEEVGFIGCSLNPVGELGAEGELLIYSHIMLLDESTEEAHSRLAAALREVAAMPLCMRSYWLPIAEWAEEHGDEPVEEELAELAEELADLEIR